jgi:hypothetical protein
MLQPRSPFGGANPESCVRFPQTQPPAALCLLFIRSEKLNKECGELFDGAFESLAWEEGTQDRIRADTCVKSCGQALTACFAAQPFEQFRHNRFYPSLNSANVVLVNDRIRI